MGSFEELELAPELVEALASEGCETPTALQRDLIPLVRRANNVVVVAGPGSGVTLAYGAPLLERVAPEGDAPLILVLTVSAERAVGLAESLGRVALATGHRVAALEPRWVLPERAHLLVGTVEGVRSRIASGKLSLGSIQAVVVDGAGSLAAAGTLDDAGRILEGLSAEVQRIVVSLPTTPEVEAFAETHAKRSVHVPAGAGAAGAGSPDRGEISLVETGEDKEASVLALVASLLTEARHVVAFVRSEDAAADLGDYLALRGYASGRPGDTEVPVWLGVDALEARAELEDAGTTDFVVLSVDVPGDVDALDQRHGGGRGGLVLALPREAPHVRAVAKEGGYRVAAATLPDAPRSGGTIRAFLESLEEAIGERDVEAYQALLEPLFARHGSSAVAAAAVALLRDRQAQAPPAEVGPEDVSAFVRLFMSVGKRDGVGPGDLVGAITGEAGIDAKQVGRIELKDAFSLVEVERSVAERVIKALNGTSIRSRATRVDYHREDRSTRGAGTRGATPSRGGPRGGGPRGGRDDRGGGRRGGRDDRGGPRRPGPRRPREDRSGE